jgi:hypothetical protein
MFLSLLICLPCVRQNPEPNPSAFIFAPEPYTKTRYRGLMKNTAQITTPFTLSNLWMARKALRKA